MKRQILGTIVVLLLLSSCGNRNRKGQTHNQSSPTDQHQLSGKISGGAYQVARNEYNQNFETRYGLLYLSTSDVPLSGRILTIDSGESGDFVFSDENWKNGKKHGKSSKWFSNGVKMYERHYNEGKWHGTVTRWWPNGQKMYIRAYNNGVRHGKEATWRSDGTPLTLTSDKSSKTDSPALTGEDLPSIDLPDLSANDPLSSSNAQATDTTSFPAVDKPSLDDNDINLPVWEDNVIEQGDEPENLPNFPPMSENSQELPPLLPPVPDQEEIGSVSNETLDPEPLLGDDLLPPVSEDELSGQDELPELGEADNETSLPDLPNGDSLEGDLPILPGMEDDGGLPLLPETDDGGLPPLPETDDGLGDLPPLPPLP